MLLAHGLGQHPQLLSQPRHIVRHPHRLGGRVETPGEPLALGGDAGGAASAVATLGLDAAHGHHRLPAHADQVDAEGHGHHGVGREAELARPHERHGFVQVGLREGLVDLGEADPEGQRHVVGEGERPGAGAALPSVDGDEVGSPAGVGHMAGEFHPEAPVAHRGLDPHREPGGVGDLLDEVDEPRHAVELRMAVGAPHGHPHRHSPGLCDGRCDLGGGQDPAQTGLRPLAQLQLHCLDRSRVEAGQEGVHAEAPVGAASAEVAGAQLERQVGALAVVHADAALAGVVQASGHGRAPVEGLHRGARQRAVGHAGDVHHRGGPEGARPVPPRAEHLGRPQFAGRGVALHREGRVPEEHVAVGFDPVV